MIGSRPIVFFADVFSLDHYDVRMGSELELKFWKEVYRYDELFIVIVQDIDFVFVVFDLLMNWNEIK